MNGLLSPLSSPVLRPGEVKCFFDILLGELRVQQSDIPRIHENLKRFMSAAQAGTLLNTHSRYLLNAERSGRITRAPEKETQIHGVVLFRRNDVLQMANAGEVQPIRRGVSKRLNA